MARRDGRGRWDHPGGPLRRPPSFFRRPWGAARVLEVGGGDRPFRGVTHIVDRHPDSDVERFGPLFVPPGVEFCEGRIEALPFAAGSFDYVYARHVLEHSDDPE